MNDRKPVSKRAQTERKPSSPLNHPHGNPPAPSHQENTARQRRPNSRFFEIIYEDSDVIVVEKPAGLPVIAPEGSRGKSLYDLITRHIQKRNPHGRAALVHRLDRDTSGVMMFAKNPQTKKILMDNWNSMITRRAYTALIEGQLPAEEGILDSWLMENRAGQVYEVPAGTHGALRAITRWKVLKTSPKFSLIELELETGRKHQIRAQLSAAGHPVAGDSRYGARTNPCGRLCLHACALEFEHPRNHALMRFESQYPEEFSPNRRRN